MVDMEEGERSTSTTDLPLWALEPAGYSRPPTPEKEKAKPKKGLADALKTTALDYGRTSSLHGINYIFESGRDLSSSRLIWVLVVLMASLTGIIWSVEASGSQRPKSIHLGTLAKVEKYCNRKS